MERFVAHPVSIGALDRRPPVTRHLIIACWLTCLGPPPLMASDDSEVVMTMRPERAAEWRVVGRARLRVLIWNVYDSELLTPTGTWAGEPPFKLVITYLRSIPSEQLVEETQKAWQDQGRRYPREKEWLDVLSAMWPDVNAGDSLTLMVDETSSSSFLFNDAPLGSVEDPDFGAAFSGIWLADDSPRPALRARLIGLN